MKALLKKAEGVDGLSISEVDVPDIGDDDVLIAVKAAAICGTDLHIMHDRYSSVIPVILGHEFSGTVTAVGKKVQGWETGDTVIAEANIETCGNCRCCKTGMSYICKERKYLGIHVDGAFAEYVRIPARLLLSMPEGIGFQEASLAEPAAVAIHALLEDNTIQVGDFVVVLGCGPIGLLAGQVAKAVGAGRVMITGRETAVKSRFRAAEDIGVFDYILNVERENPIEVVKKATGGRGADIILDTTGSAEAMRQAFQMIGRAGVIKVVGIGDQIVEVPWGRMMSEVTKIHFCRGATHSSFEKFCSLASTGRLKLKPVLSNAFPLEDWRSGFQSIESRDSVKTLLIP